MLLSGNKTLLSAMFCLYTLAPKAQSQAPQEIWTYWGAGSELNAINALMKVSNDTYPGTPVKQRVISGSVAEMRQALQVGFLGGNPPVLWQAGQGIELKNFVNSDRLAELDTVWGEVKGDEIFPAGIKKVVSFNGHQYGIPLNMHTINNVFYNKKIFEKLNLSEPKTFEELQQVSAKLKNAGYESIANAGGPSWTMYNFYVPLLSVVGVKGYYQLASGQMPFNSPEVKKALAIFGKTYAENYMKNWSGYTWSSAADQFAQGKVGMYQMGDWLNAYLVEKGMKSGEDFDVFAAPGSENASLVQVDMLAVAKTNDANRMKTAHNFLITAASVQGQKAFNSLKGSTAANLNVSDDIYNPVGKKIQGFVKDASASDKVLPSLVTLLPTELGSELGTQLAAYAQHPTEENLNTMTSALEEQRIDLQKENQFTQW